MNVRTRSTVSMVTRPADPQPTHELPVVYGVPPEGRLGHADAPAVIRNFAQQLLSRHVIPRSFPWR